MEVHKELSHILQGKGWGARSTFIYSKWKVEEHKAVHGGVSHGSDPRHKMAPEATDGGKGFKQVHTLP